MYFLKIINSLTNRHNEIFLILIPVLISWLASLSLTESSSQREYASGNRWGFRSRSLYAIGNKSTVELTGSLRPWKREEKYVNRYWLIQPEYKYWTCQKFNGFFWGAYLNGAQFNIGGKKLPFGIFAGLKKYRYEGWLAGGGISAGYHWMLDNHWNIETSLGVGYDFIRYKQYNCVKKCAGLRDKGDYHYIGPSKASISLVYLF